MSLPVCKEKRERLKKPESASFISKPGKLPFIESSMSLEQSRKWLQFTTTLLSFRFGLVFIDYVCLFILTDGWKNLCRMGQQSHDMLRKWGSSKSTREQVAPCPLDLFRVVGEIFHLCLDLCWLHANLLRKPT